MSVSYSFTDDYQSKLPPEEQGVRLGELQDYLFSKTVELQAAEEVASGHYRGAALVLHTPCEVETFLSPNGDLALICARPPAIASDDAAEASDWTFGRSFPQLPGEGLPEEEQTAPGVFLLRYLTLDTPLWLYIGVAAPVAPQRISEALEQLTLWNTWNHPGKSNLPAQEDLGRASGLHLWGTFPSLPDPLPDLLAFLNADSPGNRRALVHSRLSLEPLLPDAAGNEAPVVPYLTLELPLGRTDFGSDAVAFSGAIALSSPLIYTAGNTRIQLKGELTIKDLGEQNALSAAIDYPVGDDTITVTGRYRADQIPFVDTDTLPGAGDAPALDTQVILLFSKRQKTLTSMTFAAALGQRELFDQQLTLADLRLFFRIYEPLGSRLVTASMEARAFLGRRKSLELAFGGSYPDGRLFLTLENAALRTIAEDLDITENTEDIPDLTVRRFSVEFNYRSRFFSAELLVDSNWEWEWLKLEQVAFGIQGYSGELDLLASASFELGGVPLQIAAAYQSARGQKKSWQFTGGLAPGETIPIGRLLDDLAQSFGPIHLPPVLKELEVNALQLDYDSSTQHVFLEMGLSFPVDGRPLDLQLTLDIEKRGQGYTKRFGGTALIADMLFSLAVNKSTTESSFSAAYDNPNGLVIDPVALLKKISPSLDFDYGDDDYGLSRLSIFHLGFAFRSITVNQLTAKSYRFTGAAAWITTIPFTEGKQLEIGAELDITKVAGPQGELTGYVRGMLRTDVEFFENFRLAGEYYFSKGKKGFRLLVGIGQGQVALGVSKTTGGDTLLSASIDNLTFGDILSFMVNLVLPGEEEFQLDPPWDALNRISLSGLRLDINTTRKAFTVAYAGSISLGFMTIDTIGLSYTPPQAGKPKGVDIILSGSFLGKKQTLAWDAVNDSPPEVPGQGAALFDLRYLGVGQHVAFRSVAEFNNIGQVMEALTSAIDESGSQNRQDPGRKNRNPLEGLELLVFNAESGWLLGASFQLLRFLDLKLIFNDPLIYGLRIELSGEQAKNFAGLKFELLYRRVTDTIGVYHIDLTVPDIMRQLQFGSVSITLPLIVLDIYTNGDFKIDLGFPWRGNFARSFAVEVFPFTGAAGIYFNKLSAATATSTPIITNGVFDPVLEFGLGLKIGLGKTFQKGPLRAELSVTIQGIIEGIISWFNPRDTALKKEQYYYIKGSVALVGRLYGVVDFKVISVDVEVLIRAAVLFVVEVYQPIFVTLVAEVSVRASIKIVFIRIHFSFHLKLSLDFTIGSARPTPWILDPDQSKRQLPGSTAAARALVRSLFVEETGMARDLSGGPSLADRLAALQVDSPLAGTPLSWQPVQVWKEKVQLDIFFQPGFTRNDAGIKGVGLFFIENAIPAAAAGYEDYTKPEGADDTDFDNLLHALLSWALHAYYTQPAGEQPAGSPAEEPLTEVRKSDLEELFTFFVNRVEDPQAPFGYEQLRAFLEANFIFAITLADNDFTATPFPVFPEFTMQAGADGPKVDFSAAGFQLSAQDLADFQAYAALLRVQHGSSVEPPPVDATKIQPGDALATPLSVAAFLFEDYFALLIRTLIQSAVDYLDQNGLDRIGRVDLLNALNREGSYNAYQHIAGLASRFVLHGQRLPFRNADRSGWSTVPLFERSGQQFAIDSTTLKPGFPITLTLNKDNPAVQLIVPGQSAPADKLSYLIRSQDKTVIDNLAGKIPAFLQPVPETLDWYRLAPQRFTVQKGLVWTNPPAALHNGAEKVVVLELPDSLQTWLAGREQAALTPQSGETKSGEKEMTFTDLSAYRWVCRVDLRIRRIPNLRGVGDLPFTYQLIGADEAGKDRLEALWSHLQNAGATPDLHLLYTNENGGVQSTGGDWLLARTNLSTLGAGPVQFTARDLAPPAPARHSAELSESLRFLELLWEGSTVNSGGYYLDYREGAPDSPAGLPDELFTGTNETTLHLLAELPDSTTTTVRPFINGLLIDAGRVSDENLTVITTDEKQPVLRVPAGHLGIRLTRPNAGETPEELDNLYQLLVYQLQETPAFFASEDSQPIGPREDDPDTITDDHLWIYEKVIPAHRFAKNKPALPLAGLTSLGADPYTGIGPQAKLKLGLHWQDIYGNRLLPIDPKDVFFDIRYFDPLLGINQWPSVIEDYFFQPGTSPRTTDLHLALRFDQSPYVSGAFSESDQRVATSREIYRQVFFQIHQPDVQFHLLNNVLPASDRKVLDRDVFRRFVVSVYQYLDNLKALQPVEAHFSAGTSLDDLGRSYHVPVRQLAEENRSLQNLFTPGSILHIPVRYTIGEADTLEAIDAHLQFSLTGSGDQLPRLITDLETVKDILTPGKELKVQGTTYIVQAGDSLADLARVFRLTTQQVAAALKAEPELLISGANVDLTIQYPAQAGDSLALIETKIQQALLTHPRREAILPGSAADIARTNAAAAILNPNPAAGIRIPGRIRIPAPVDPAGWHSVQPQQRLSDITSARSGESGWTTADLIAANQRVDGLLKPGRKLLLPRSGDNGGVSSALTILARSSRLSESDWSVLSGLETRKNETFATLLNHFREALTSDERPNPEVSFADLALAFGNHPDLLEAGQWMILPPAMALLSVSYATQSQNGRPLYPEELIFPLRITVELSREESRVYDKLKTGHPTVTRVPAALSPKMNLPTRADTDDPDASNLNQLRGFAEQFEAAFPGLRLAVGYERPVALPENVDPAQQFDRQLWAVHFGPHGIHYDIDEQHPFFFGLAPLANTPLSGEFALCQYTTGAGLKRDDQETLITEAKRFDSVDLNAAAREFLHALEEFFDPAILLPALKEAETAADAQRLLQVKKRLAEAITRQVAPIILAEEGDAVPPDSEAREAIRQRLLINLAEGYDIETIVQYPVTVQLPEDAPWPAAPLAPRVFGQPVLRDVIGSSRTDNNAFDFSLSSARIPLAREGSQLTFFFDTKSPEKYEDIQLRLDFRINHLEYQIASVPGIQEYQASSWLTFLTGVDSNPSHPDSPNHLGVLEIPIPLRQYPLPPSLLLQRTEADPDSQNNLDQIREWQYRFTYEHPDVAQDTIDLDIDFNVIPSDGTPGVDSTEPLGNSRQLLPAALINFTEIFQKQGLGNDLNLLTKTNPDPAEQNVSQAAVATLTLLSEQIAEAWEKWSLPSAADSVAGSLFEINEAASDHAKVVDIQTKDQKRDFPRMLLPGYELGNTPLPLIAGPEETALTMAAWDGNVYRWNLPNAAPAVLDLSEAIEAAVALSPDGHWLAKGYEDGRIRLWSLDGDNFSLSNSAPTAEWQQPAAVTTLTFSTDNGRLASGGSDGAVRLRLYREGQWIETGIVLQPAEAASAVSSIALAATGYLAAGYRHGRLLLWPPSLSAAAAIELVNFGGSPAHSEPIGALAFTANGKRLASGGWDGRTFIWEVEQQENPPVLLQDAGVADRVLTLAFHPQTNLLATGGEDGVIRLWQWTATPAALTRLSRYRAPIAQLTFHPDGRGMAAGAWDRTVLWWTALQNGSLPDQVLEAEPGMRRIRYYFTEKTAEEAALDPIFGESDIPDRTLSIPDLDIIYQQNAWAAVWLTRNKALLKGRRTNPAFLFRTPKVRFANPAAPFLLNEVEWDLGSELKNDPGMPAHPQLADYLKRLFQRILPAPATTVPDYDQRIACRYAFRLARGKGLNEDLWSVLPVVLGLRIDDPADPAAFEAYINALADRIETWRTSYRPATEEGRFILSLSLFSRLDPESRNSIPMLQIAHLGLRLNDFSQ